MKYINYNAAVTGERIRTQRLRIGCRSQDDFVGQYGEKLHVKTREGFSPWERGERSAFSVWQLIELCKIFGCDPGYLLGEYDTLKREAADVCEETGLSESAVHFLSIMHSNALPVPPDARASNAKALAALNDVLESPYATDLLLAVDAACEDVTSREMAARELPDNAADDTITRFDEWRAGTELTNIIEEIGKRRAQRRIEAGKGGDHNAK